ncbi:MAG: lysophospholipid acyltransferase family protein [Rhodospirillaceae bacterium]|nr:lysophospholipid acyltransferase family protein [Rhodospirillaceae bacterium]MBT5244073.1 lysophospholipid acyltransferase family protein [Rhodospirillaceae bacterium]MBT5560893.1 lysophospholipid acyltransferase family protein [Rhodospirillaceae bacterium]MBT6241182.1 lysophospholipid acyltransferase family protein [Rhodospirillaceae bacterium]MBT7136285.1 lysophospholipid acyltransferase family protein [Rhodospirillaceae bacterium]
MRLDKRILRSQVVQNCLCFLAAAYIRFVYLTSRWSVVGGDIPKRFWDEDKMFLLCFWHGRLMMMPHCWDMSKTIHMMISMHRDGRILSDTVAKLGIKTIVGSTSRGGAAALRTMVKTVKAGEYVGLTPDGPRGPRMRAQEGVVTIARLANIPVIPISYASSNSKILGSWDHFVAALPFGRGVFVWGEPIHVPHTADKTELEKSRQEIEDSLNAISAEADRLCGLRVIEPAPPAGETAP